MEETPKKDFINIEEVIGSKNPGLLKILPGFLIKYIKRILHQDSVNDFIRRKGDKTSFDFVHEIIVEFGANVTFEGLENIPEKGGAIVASNHPVGGLDGMVLLEVLGKKRKDIKFFVNDVLTNLKNLSDLFIGVNKHGKNPTDVVKEIDELYASDMLVMIYPAGLVSRKQEGGIIRDLEWKKSFISKARKYKKDVIPVHVSGQNSNFFYNLARWRQRLGIKANIEMFYLVDEMYHQLGKNMHVKIGKPIPYTMFTKNFTDKEWAQKMKDHVYALAENDSSKLLIPNAI